MLSLSSDDTFQFELLRVLGHARYAGSDIGEVLEVADRIKPGDFESWYTEFNALAERVNTQAGDIDAAKNPISSRDAYFRASNYYRAADFFIHGNVDDPRIDALWEKQTAAFNKAAALLSIPAERLVLKADGFEVSAIYYRAAGDKPKPTVIFGNGYDGAQEEMLHVSGFAALERGYNVITYEGPGQPTVRRNQGLGFIPEWEKVVSPVVDYLVTRPEVDASKIGLYGYSMGGWLAGRAAAVEHRLAALIMVDGVYDVYSAYAKNLPPEALEILASDDTSPFDAQVMGAIASGMAPTAMRWGVEQGLWSFAAKTPAEFFAKTKPMTLKGIEDKIKCPAWIGEASGEEFFVGQPQLVKEALGDRATLVRLTEEDGAQYHCHVGAATLLNQKWLDWFQDVVSNS